MILCGIKFLKNRTPILFWNSGQLIHNKNRFLKTCRKKTRDDSQNIVMVKICRHGKDISLQNVATRNRIQNPAHPHWQDKYEELVSKTSLQWISIKNKWIDHTHVSMHSMVRCLELFGVQLYNGKKKSKCKDDIHYQVSLKIFYTYTQKEINRSANLG